MTSRVIYYFIVLNKTKNLMCHILKLHHLLLITTFAFSNKQGYLFPGNCRSYNIQNNTLSDWRWVSSLNDT